jgi:hypothetical protein
MRRMLLVLAVATVVTTIIAANASQAFEPRKLFSNSKLHC